MYAFNSNTYNTGQIETVDGSMTVKNYDDDGVLSTGYDIRSAYLVIRNVVLPTHNFKISLRVKTTCYNCGLF